LGGRHNLKFLLIKYRGGWGGRILKTFPPPLTRHEPYHKTKHKLFYHNISWYMVAVFIVIKQLAHDIDASKWKMLEAKESQINQ
jgi:hypothetical protein